MSPTITYQFSSPWLAVRACSFHLQRVTAIVHGWLFMHWATIRVRSEELAFQLLLGGDQSGRKHIRLHASTLYCTPFRWYMCSSQQVGAGIYSYGYSAQLHSELKLKMKPCNTFTMIRFTITILTVKVTLY